MWISSSIETNRRKRSMCPSRGYLARWRLAQLAPRASEGEGGWSAQGLNLRTCPAVTLAGVYPTVKADILKEDQAQNECIFAIEFALRMMGDIQEFFIAQRGCLGIPAFGAITVLLIDDVDLPALAGLMQHAAIN